MMARSNRSKQRPDTLMQDRNADRSTNSLATHGRTIQTGQNEPCHSLRRHGRSTSISGPAGPAVGTSGSGRYCCKSLFGLLIKNSLGVGHEPTWRLSFSLCQRLRNFAGRVDKKLRNRAERAVLQGDDSNRQGCDRQVNRQDLDLRAS